VLLVPPLAAPSTCFDLRRDCSLAEHLVGRARPTYMLDYGEIAFSDRELGLEHWVQDVIPAAVDAVRADAGDRPVHLLGWCLGGIMSLLSVAGHRELPIASATLVASPFDFSVGLIAGTLRPLAGLTRGVAGTVAYRLLGGAPAPLVKRGFQLSALDKQLTKPLAILRNLDDRDFLAQLEAVDNFTDHMAAYPGRTFGQLYHRFFRVNELAGGTLELPDQTIDLAEVELPVLAVAGRNDVLAPRAAVHHVAKLLPRARRVQIETGPGGHLGVLTGRNARRTTWVWADRFMESVEGRLGEASRRAAAAA
jgi:polyhydroxyalkanoate synthase